MKKNTKAYMYIMALAVILLMILSSCSDKIHKEEITQTPTMNITAKPTGTKSIKPSGETPSISNTESTEQAATNTPEITSTIPADITPDQTPTIIPDPTPTVKPEKEKSVNDIKPVFSIPGGLFSGTKSLSVTLSDEDKNILEKAGIKDYTIRISFNQEEPSRTGLIYTTPISLPHSYSQTTENLNTSIIRAAVFDRSGSLIGKIETATYIKSRRDELINLPIVSLVTKDSYLYDDAEGIIPHADQRGSAWERPVHLEFFEVNGMTALSQDAGIRIFGGSSRGLMQKSFRISARKSSYFNVSKYDGAGKFKYALFPGRLKEDGSRLEAFDSFVLRNGGNDSMVFPVQNERNSFMRDGLAALIFDGASKNIDTMAYRPVIVMLNGSYYGILNMREHESDNYVANVYNISDKENITIISSELDTSNGGRYDGGWFYYKQDDGPEGELEKYINLLKDIKNGKYTFEQASEYIDMDNFMEYCAVSIFICNTDWPHNNIRLWKYADGKYRFMLRDADLGMARYTVGADPYEYPSELYTKADAKNLRYLLWSSLTQQQKEQLYDYSALPSVDGGTYPDPLHLQGLLNFCLKDSGFRSRFVSYCEKLATQIWTPEKLCTLIDQQKANIQTEMKYHIERWYDFIPDTNIQYWANNTVGESMKQWANQRSGVNGYFMKEIREVCNTY